jgi:hypothetical protein|tara:strand:+ start:519 stop:1031 length:513 start_codon:yes stop_codon:yes gene_type:complete
MKVQLINDILTLEENSKLLDKLMYHQWYLTRCRDYQNLTEWVTAGNRSGFSVETLASGKPYDSNLNEEAFKITKIACEKAGITNYEIRRFLWNLYFPGDITEIHMDEEGDGFTSILYNVHTTDGGTIIDNVFYPDKMGQVKIYKSNVKHQGVAPVKDHTRLNLNILLKIT